METSSGRLSTSMRTTSLADFITALGSAEGQGKATTDEVFHSRYTGDMKLAKVQERLDSMRAELSQAGVSALYVFGSVANNSAREDSDVDLAIEFDRPIDLFAFAGLKARFEEVLGTRVDLVMPSGLRPEMRERIMREAVRAA